MVFGLWLARQNGLLPPTTTTVTSQQPRISIMCKMAEITIAGRNGRQEEETAEYVRHEALLSHWLLGYSATRNRSATSSGESQLSPILQTGVVSHPHQKYVGLLFVQVSQIHTHSNKSRSWSSNLTCPYLRFLSVGDSHCHSGAGSDCVVGGT